MLKKIFSRIAGPAPSPARISEEAFFRSLRCHPSAGETRMRDIRPGAAWGAGYAFRNCHGNDVIDLTILSYCGVVPYRTQVVAKRVADGELEIQSIVLDNEAQPLRHAGEIRAVLDFIGERQLRAIDFDRMPHSHLGYAGLSPLGRLISTCTQPLRGLF